MDKIEIKKRVLFLDPGISKANPTPDSRGYRQARICYFAKYFPKYLRNFDFEMRNASTRSKIKGTKIIKNLYDYSSSKAREYRLFFQNKARFIKNINSSHFRCPIQLIETLKLFTNLRTIRLYYGKDSRPVGIEGHYLIKTLAKIKRLKNVKSIEFGQLVNSSQILLHAIDACPRILSRLETLSLFSMSDQGNDDEILRIFIDCKNLLKYVTSLYLPALRSPSHLRDFQSLENSCPNLKKLDFEFASRHIIYDSIREKRYSETRFPVKVNYLSAVETFQNLRSLRLHIADIFTSLNDFSSPPFIQSLFLNFKECLTEEILTRIDKAFIGKNSQQILEFFETNPILAKFYGNFQHRSHLNTLEMFFTSDVGPEDYQHHNYLAQNLVKKIPSLDKLSFCGGESYWGLNYAFRSPVRDFYLPQLLTSCHPSREVLQTLQIGHEKVIYSNFNLLSSRNKFLSLSTITLTGTIHQNDPSNSQIGVFLRQVMTLSTSLKIIKFHTLVYGTIKSLLSLLQQLKKLRKPENLQLKLQIKFFDSQTPEDLGAGFKPLIQELQENELEYPKLPGVSLIIYMQQAKHAKDFLEAYGEKFDDFEIYGLGYSLGDFD